MPSNCANCGISYSVEPEELEWIAANDGDMPSLCPRCRAFKGGIQDETIPCSQCGKIFIYPRELRLFARLFNWARPRRCLGGCRRPGPELDEHEKKLNDFLKRLRNARKASGSIGSMSFSMGRGASPGAGRLTSAEGSVSKRTESPEISNSLAQALKEFQEKKRRRS